MTRAEYELFLNRSKQKNGEIFRFSFFGQAGIHGYAVLIEHLPLA